MGISNPIPIAKWIVKNGDDQKEKLLTSPMNLLSSSRPYISAQYVDLLSHTSVNECVKMYGSLKRKNLLDKVTQEIQIVFSDVERFDIIPYPDGSTASVSVIKRDGTSLPLYAYGDGLQRWFFILGLIESNKSSIICVDEIDTGLHPDAQIEFCENLIKSAVNNETQLFVTTHNIEFIDNFLSVTPDMEDRYTDGIKVITLREKEGEVIHRVLSVDDAYSTRRKFNAELR